MNDMLAKGQNDDLHVGWTSANGAHCLIVSLAASNINYVGPCDTKIHTQWDLLTTNPKWRDCQPDIWPTFSRELHENQHRKFDLDQSVAIVLDISRSLCSHNNVYLCQYWWSLLSCFAV